MNRREWFRQIKNWSVMGLVAFIPLIGGRALYPTPEFKRKGLLRPPGASLTDSVFIKACIGCGLCGEVCPPKCIKFFKNSGEISQHTPYIDPQVKGCILCNKCIEVCPTNALVATKVRDVNMGQAKIDRTACYPWVDRGVCGACVSICPLGDDAIRFTKGNIYRPKVEKACVGCGLCVEVCPHPLKPIAVYRTEPVKVS